MMITCALVVMTSLLPLCLGTPPDTVSPKKYVVNLDLPPEKRWQDVLWDYKQLVKDVHQMLKTYIPDEMLPYFELLASDLDSYLDEPYADEMRGIALMANMSLGDVVMCNLIYDATAYCTSIVSQDDQGTIWHSRNLDFKFTDILKNLTIHVDFQTGGQTNYSAITFAGYIGIATGQKPKVFTVTTDERDQGSVLWNVIVGLLDRSAVPVSFLVRDALAYKTTFDDAVKLLSTTPTAADVYFIMGGTQRNQGTVITKGRLEADDIWNLDTDNKRWFLVETNYDHWLPPPPYDDRRTPATKAMNTMGRGNVSVTSLFDVMSTSKVLNKQTTYTVVMSAAKPNVMTSWIRV